MNIHIPVLGKEVIYNLNINPEGIYIDATLGEGGHSEEIIKRLTPKGTLVGIDIDEDVVRVAEERFKEWKKQRYKVYLLVANYNRLAEILRDLNIKEVDGILFDLGVSSYHLEDKRRGFSFRYNAPLDMRFNRSKELTAAYVVNKYKDFELIRVLKEFGQEKYAKRMVKEIIKTRRESWIETTKDLMEIVKRAIPKNRWPKKIHPATKTFQALRIEVNDELNTAEEGIRKSIKLLKKGGRICIVTFHSLEDALVKKIFREESKDCLCPPQQPFCKCVHKKSLKIITKKPIYPSAEERKINPRSRSAKLRVGERV